MRVQIVVESLRGQIDPKKIFRALTWEQAKKNQNLHENVLLNFSLQHWTLRKSDFNGATHVSSLHHAWVSDFAISFRFFNNCGLQWLRNNE
jgi:hypothetical protein